MNCLSVLRFCLSAALVGLGISMVSGCGSRSFMHTPAVSTASVNVQPNPKLNRPSRALGNMPYVLVIGDAMVTSWMTPAVLHEHTLWIAAGTPSRSGNPHPTEYSGDVAARLPALLSAKRYDVVVILVGANDMQAPQSDFQDDGRWAGPCGTNALAPKMQTCSSLLTMMNAAHATGAKVILCQVPKTETYAQQYTDFLGADEDSFNYNLKFAIGLGTPPNVWNPDAVLVLPALKPDPTGPTYDPEWTYDGYLMSDEGAMRAADSLEVTINKLGYWGLR